MKLRQTKWIMILGLCTLATLIYTSHLYFFHLHYEDPTSWPDAFRESAAEWYAWLPLAPLILGLASKFPFRKDHWAVPLLVHVPAGLLFSFAQVALHAVLDQTIFHSMFSAEKIIDAGSSLFARTFHFGILVYWILVTAQNTAEYYKDREVRASELQTQLAKAQLNSLRMQLNPHFLFNTLNTISEFVDQDPPAAQKMIAKLGDLIRLSLNSDQDQEVRLSEELQFLDQYLEIEQMRFQNRLTIRKEISESVMNSFVPALLLQPLVENSIRHGIAPSAKPGVIEIHANRIGENLEIKVVDNGKGAGANPLREGIGLGNTRARLKQLYGEASTLVATPQDGMSVTVTVPYHEEEMI